MQIKPTFLSQMLNQETREPKDHKFRIDSLVIHIVFSITDYPNTFDPNVMNVRISLYMIKPCHLPVCFHEVFQQVLLYSFLSIVLILVHVRSKHVSVFIQFLWGKADCVLWDIACIFVYKVSSVVTVKKITTGSRLSACDYFAKLFLTMSLLYFAVFFSFRHWIGNKIYVQKVVTLCLFCSASVLLSLYTLRLCSDLSKGAVKFFSEKKFFCKQPEAWRTVFEDILRKTTTYKIQSEWP